MSRKTKLFIYRVGGLFLLYIAVILLGRSFFPDFLGFAILIIIIGVLLFASIEGNRKGKRRK